MDSNCKEFLKRFERATKSTTAVQQSENISSCQICGKKLDHMNIARQTQHVHRCQQLKEKHAENSNSDQNNVANLVCPVCFRCFSDRKKRLIHLKQCGKKHNMSTDEIIHSLKLQEKQDQERKDAGLPSLSALDAKRKIETGVKKKSVPRKIDESLRIAMALSLSEHEKEDHLKKMEKELLSACSDTSDCDEKCNDKLTGDTSERLQKNKTVKGTNLKTMKRKRCRTPPLLVTTSEQRSRIIEAKLGEMISNSDNNTPEFVSLPPFPPDACDGDVVNFKMSRLANKQKRENSLWKLSNLCDVCELSQFYVPALSNFIEPSDIVVGSKLKSFTQIPGRRPSDFCTMQSLDTRFEDSLQNFDILSCLPSQDSYVDTKDSGETSPKNFRIKLMDKMILDFQKLLDSSLYSDVTIMTEDDILSAHKNILAVRCPEILEKVKEGNILELTNFSSTSVKIFLSYIYTGELVCSSDDTLSALLRLSEYLKSKELVQVISKQESVVQNNSKEIYEDSSKPVVNLNKSPFPEAEASHSSCVDKETDLSSSSPTVHSCQIISNDSLSPMKGESESEPEDFDLGAEHNFSIESAGNGTRTVVDDLKISVQCPNTDDEQNSLIAERQSPDMFSTCDINSDDSVQFVEELSISSAPLDCTLNSESENKDTSDNGHVEIAVSKTKPTEGPLFGKKLIKSCVDQNISLLTRLRNQRTSVIQTNKSLQVGSMDDDILLTPRRMDDANDHQENIFYMMESEQTDNPAPVEEINDEKEWNNIIEKSLDFMDQPVVSNDVGKPDMSTSNDVTHEKPKKGKLKEKKKVPVTPLPRYSIMETPELRTNLSKFGVKKLPKKMAVKLLKHIYEETHPFVTDSEGDSILEPPITMSQQHYSPAKKCPKFSLTQPARNAMKSKRQQPNISKKLSELSKDAKKQDIDPSQEVGIGGKKLGSQSTQSSSDDSDDSDSNNILEESILASQNEVCTQESISLMSKVKSYIKQDEELYCKVLKYQPIPIEELHEKVKKVGIKLSMSTLMDILDQQCITFRIVKNENRSKKSRKKKNS